MEADGRRYTRRGVVSTFSVPISIARLAEPVLRAVGLHARALDNVLALALTEVDLPVAGLPPAFEGYSILHLSDLHVDKVPGLIERAAETMRGACVDLVVLTGDIQSFGAPAAPRAAAVVAELLGAVSARDGAVGVLGNHDSHSLVPALEARGVRMLVNEHFSLERAGTALQLSGLDDVHHFYTEEADRTLRGRDRKACSVAVVHSPEFADVAAEAGYALYLSGHTHGGQVCLPGGRPVFTALDYHQRLASGVWRWGEMSGFTSRGVGVTHRARFNCPPELAVLRLRRRE